MLLIKVVKQWLNQWLSISNHPPLAWVSWVSPPSGGLWACLCGSSPAPLQTLPGSTAWPSCACWTCPACFLPGSAHWWSPAAGWSSTLSHSQNALSLCAAAFPFSILSQLQKEKTATSRVTNVSKWHVAFTLSSWLRRLRNAHHRFQHICFK